MDKEVVNKVRRAEEMNRILRRSWTDFWRVYDAAETSQEKREIFKNTPRGISLLTPRGEAGIINDG